MSLLNELKTICHRTGIDGFFFNSEKELLEAKREKLDAVLNSLLTWNKSLQLWTFNLPAGCTCPGATDWCRKQCYGKKGKYTFPDPKKGQKRRWEATKHPDFVRAMIGQIKRKRKGIGAGNAIRIHSTGDLYDVKYFKKWLQIIEAMPNEQFYLYTRMWRKGTKWRNRLDAAEEKYPNLLIHWSVDPSSGVPKTKDGKVTKNRKAFVYDPAPEYVYDKKYKIYRRLMPDPNCLKQLTKDGEEKMSCAKCKRCFTKGVGDVTLIKHPPTSLVKSVATKLGLWQPNMTDAEIEDMLTKEKEKLEFEREMAREKEKFEKSVKKSNRKYFEDRINKIEMALTEVRKYNYVLCDDCLDEINDILECEELQLIESEITLSDVEKWKKDLKRLTKIYRDIKPDREDEKTTLKKFLEAKEIYKNFRNNFEEWVYVGILGMPHAEGLPSSHVYFKKETPLMANIRKTAYAAILELGRHDMFPEQWDYRVEKHLPAPWELTDKKKKSLIVKYQKPFNRVFKDIEEFLKNSGDKIQSKMPSSETINIEGFPFQTKTFATDTDEDFKNTKEVIDSLKKALSILKKRASKIYPKLIKSKIPIIYDRELSLDVAATYDEFKKNITIKRILGIKKPKFVASIIAHELCHHIYKTVLSKKSIGFWQKAIKENYGKLDVDRVLKLWKDPKEYSLTFTNRIAKTDPDLHLQLLAYFSGKVGEGGRRVNTRDDFIKATKENHPGVMKNPITSYAHKNPEEAFCEALSTYIIYGSRAVYPIVKSWLKTILPEIRMNEGVEYKNKLIEDLQYLSEMIIHGKRHGGIQYVVAYRKDEDEDEDEY